MKKSKWILFVLPFAIAACGDSAKKSGPVQGGLAEYVKQARAVTYQAKEDQGSLWSEANTRSDPFRDLKAYRVADIVTISVSESTNAVSQATTDSSKTSQTSAQFPNLFGLEGRVAELPNLLSGGRSSDFQGDASTTRRTILQTSIATRVVEVFPNGNLLLEGNREMLINGERQIVIIRGVVRPTDITPQNVVRSTVVSELEIRVAGRGIVTRAQDPGILHRVLSGFWPF